VKESLQRVAKVRMPTCLVAAVRCGNFCRPIVYRRTTAGSVSPSKKLMAVQV